jgi:methylitaconate Delta-isomerase
MTVRIKCAVLRGGTSRAVILRREDVMAAGMPEDELLMCLLGSGDPREIDGLGGADQLTSKAAIVGRSERADDDVEYTFVQVLIDERGVDYSTMCGNISAAVGVFAVEEGLVPVVQPETLVRVHNTNTDARFTVRVPVHGGRVAVDGDFAIAGVPGTGAELRMDFSGTVGATTGALLPTAQVQDELFVPELGSTVPVSIVDVAKPVVFFAADAIGFDVRTSPSDVSAAVLDRFVAVQRAAATRINLPIESGLPRPAAVAPPTDYRHCLTGALVAASEMTLAARWIGHLQPPLRIRKAYAASGAFCTAVAASMPGTVPFGLRSGGACALTPAGETVRIGHPSGIFPVHVRLADGLVAEVSLSRTARRIADGIAYVEPTTVTRTAP